MSNIPVVALCDSDTPLSGIDLVIGCNNKGKLSLGLLFWLLAREVLKMRGTVNAAKPWTESVDLFFYRDPEDLEKSEVDVEETNEWSNENQQATTQEWENEWETTNAGGWTQGGNENSGWESVEK